MNLSKELVKIARLLIADKSEKEVENFLLSFLKNTPFANKVFSVGGYNRDELLGLDAKDLDIVVEMQGGSEKLTKYLHKEFPNETSTPRQMGANYPIWQLVFKDNITHDDKTYETKGATIEFADTMKEEFKDPNSRQRSTQPGTLKDDIERRDFTVNSLLKDLTLGELIDLTGTSINDIKKGILRGNPNVSLDKIFNDDPLRMIRLIRFQCKYDWQIPKSVLQTVKRNAHRIEIVSAERIMGELEKVMKVGKLGKAIRLMKTTGLLQYVLPEIDELRGVEQHPDHHAEGDVYQHVIKVLENAPKTLEGQLAALLHDVGKSKTQNILEDKIQFLGHEDVGAEIAEAILYRLKFDAKTIKKVKAIVENHMRPHSLGNASEKALRKFIRDVGEETADAILDMAEADSLGSYPVENVIPELRERIKKVKESPLKVPKKPILDGEEIMDILGIKPGAKVGEVGRFLLELEDDYASSGKKLTKEIAKKEVLKEFGN